ncbi:hypothetical protein WJX84_001680 [Apatococcus fuscideae]|uniref:LYR motif-containing protein 9 n=1 Tax=Apatococcus fuscideae TaxID=2026836 RepID=A0AAW1SN14_9CHLO
MNPAAVQLYRELFRKTRQLPKASWDYYRQYIRENFRSFDDEVDQDRLKDIIASARKDAGWVLKTRSKK